MNPQYQPSCKVCERGVLVPKKIYRMSGPVVVVGYILLIPSILGMSFSFLVFFGVIIAGGSEASRARSEAITEMRHADVPEPIISAVIENPDLDTTALMDRVSMYQLSWIDDAQKKLRSANTQAGLGAMFGGGLALVIGIACFVGGLLGWLLVMKKRVLQCSVCKATVSAS